MLRLTPVQLERVDRLAVEIGETRSAALRIAIRAGIKALDVTPEAPR